MKKQSGKKLVEILAVELKEWPGHAEYADQDYDKEVRFGPGLTASDFFAKELAIEDVGYSDSDGIPWAGRVTRSMWEAERAKLSKPKANAHGWVRNRGRKNPLDVCTLVDARLRSGDVVTGKFSDNLKFVHTGGLLDVMAYRVNQSVDAAAPEVTNDGPLQWRDRITEIDREVEALEEERASLIQKLADEGFKLIKREAVELPDMSDWRNWREGDVVEFVRDGCESQYFTKGRHYVVADVVGDSLDPISVKEDDDGDYNGWKAEYFKFVSRPTK